LFLADGMRASILCISRQWTSPTERYPFRYGGAAFPWPDPPEAIPDAVGKLTRALALRGLNSLDMLIEDDRVTVLEVNPRPSASMDLAPNAPWLRWHIEAARGKIPPATMRATPARAASIAYAPRRLTIPDRDWPAWTRDRPMPGQTVAENEPLCSVLAEAPTIGAAEALAAKRIGVLLSQLEETLP
jgi:predicted ATP-grasp superfamily ATP-dependent carboligase